MGRCVVVEGCGRWKGWDGMVCLLPRCPLPAPQGAGTDSRVSAELVGAGGRTGPMVLDSSVAFERGQVDTFIVDALDVGQLTKMVRLLSVPQHIWPGLMQVQRTTGEQNCRYRYPESARPRASCLVHHALLCNPPLLHAAGDGGRAGHAPRLAPGQHHRVARPGAHRPRAQHLLPMQVPLTGQE